MSIKRIQPGPRYSEAVIHNDTVYLSGQVGEGDDVSAQTRSALAYIEELLAEAGSDKSKLVFVTIWLADIADYDAMNAVWDAWIGGENAPARATGESKLASSDYRVEIIATAALS
ncbi:MAG TPA: RidA family protein [Caulobacteraceae bacterium]|jgi:enamine deaminase RidA (YjgF/YER057c/UK114 family)|nr:RidA family protein [Caulobacteraceae bacterium]